MVKAYYRKDGLINEKCSFLDIPEKNVLIMDTLDKYYQTSQVLELIDFPFLEGFIKGIFVR